MKNDSINETRKHKDRVFSLMSELIKELNLRAVKHDDSKLVDPEVKYFNSVVGQLKELEYGSEEYEEQLKILSKALEHHYKHNRHHPEHHKNGINDMTLVDLVEMICDWKAASERHDSGDIFKSIEINQKRFGYGDELKSILINTANKWKL